MTSPSGRDGNDYRLTEEEIAAFHRDGYVTLREVMSEAELAAIEPTFDRFIAGQVPDMGRDFCDMSGPYDRKFVDFNLVNAVLPRRYDPTLAGNLYERRCAAISRQLIGESATLDYDPVGFTHSHNDPVTSQTHLGALALDA